MSAVPALAALAFLVFASPAGAAAGWSAPRAFDAGGGADAEPVPRAAIGADGRSVVAWRTAGGRLVAVTGDAHGRFSSPVTVARRTSDYAVADGAIAYEAGRGIYVARRSGRTFRALRVA